MWLIWLTIVACAGTFGILKAMEVYKHYKTKPAILNFERDHKNWEEKFPTVTVCQMKLIPDPYLEEAFLNETQNEIPWTNEVRSYLEDLAFNDYTTYSKYKDYAEGRKKEYLKPEQYRVVLDRVVPHMPVNTGTNKKIWNTHPPMDADDVATIRTFTEVGVCSTFNTHAMYLFSPGYINSHELNITQKAILYRHTDQPILTTKNLEYFYKVFLSGNFEVIDILSQVTNVMDSDRPTFETMTYTSETFLSTKSFLSLTREQRKCRKYDEAEDLPNSPLYSKKLCKIECRMRLCLKYCGCLPYYYRNFNGEKICNLTELYCLSQYEDELVTLRKEEKSLCSCDNVCESTLYNVYTAYCTEWLGESNLVIRLSQFPIIRYKGNVIFTRMDVLTQIGGIMGLMLGCSILSMVELVYFFTLRFYWGVFKGIRVKNN